MKYAARTIQEENLDNSLSQRYENYLTFADDGKGNEFMTGKPLKTFIEWMES